MSFIAPEVGDLFFCSVCFLGHQRWWRKHPSRVSTFPYAAVGAPLGLCCRVMPQVYQGRTTVGVCVVLAGNGQSFTAPRLGAFEDGHLAALNIEFYECYNFNYRF